MEVCERQCLLREVATSCKPYKPCPPVCRLLSQMTNDGAADPTHCELARCNYQGLKCYQPQSYGLSNNAGVLYELPFLLYIHLSCRRVEVLGTDCTVGR